MYVNLGVIMSSGKKSSFSDKNNKGSIKGKKIDFNDVPEYDNENRIPQKNENKSNCFVPMEPNPNSSQGVFLPQNGSPNPQKHVNSSFTPLHDYIYPGTSQKEIKPGNYNNIMVPEMRMKQIIKTSCTCTKTGCIKKYCACFSIGRFCQGCECKNCQNNPKAKGISNILNELNVKEKVSYPKNQTNNQKSQRVICNCTKSNCKKKYCECFKQQIECNNLCRCVDCQNKNKFNLPTYPNWASSNKNMNEDYQSNNFNPYLDDSNQKNVVPENQIPEYSQNNSYRPLILQNTFTRSYIYKNNFQCEAQSVYVSNGSLKLEKRLIELNIIGDLNKTPKFSNKKRLRPKIDTSNVKTCPTTNSSRRKRKGHSLVNKNIKKKKLQLNS